MTIMEPGDPIYVPGPQSSKLPPVTGTDVTTPVLAQLVNVAPNIPGTTWNGDQGQGNGSAQGSVNQDMTQFTVSTGDIEAAENSILAETANAVQLYNSLRDEVGATKATIYTAVGSYNKDVGNAQNPETLTVPYSDQQTVMDLAETQDQTLRAVADAITLVGQFVSLLNNCAQAYGQADIYSFIKPVPPGTQPGTQS